MILPMDECPTLYCAYKIIIHIIYELQTFSMISQNFRKGPHSIWIEDRIAVEIVCERLVYDYITASKIILRQIMIR